MASQIVNQDPERDCARPSVEASEVGLGDDLSEEDLIDGIRGERGIPPVNPPRSAPISLARKIGGWGIALVAVLLIAAINSGLLGQRAAKRGIGNQPSAVADLLPPLQDPPALVEPTPPKSAPRASSWLDTGNLVDKPQPIPTVRALSTQSRDVPQTPEQRKREDNLFAFGRVASTQSGTETGTGGSHAPSFEQTQAQALSLAQQYRGESPTSESAPGIATADGLSSALKTTHLEGTRAGFVEAPDLVITRGAFLDCVLETAIATDVTGLTRCRLSHDIYSTNGRVVLLERGSLVTGQYQAGMKQGQARVFVVWTRVQTPHGVVIDIDSPGTDSLGRSGLDGYIDTHFAERFGAAVLFSVLGDVGQYAVAQARSNNSGFEFSNTAGTTKDIGAIALENSINIPPTLRKNQGDSVAIVVGRDLDFRGVYALELKQ